MVDITGLDKVKVLQVLYKHARPLGLGRLHYIPGELDYEEAKMLLFEGMYFDYLKGRVMKVNLDSNTEFEERLYDRDNGEGAAQKAVSELRGAK